MFSHCFSAWCIAFQRPDASDTLSEVHATSLILNAHLIDFREMLWNNMVSSTIIPSYNGKFTELAQTNPDKGWSDGEEAERAWARLDISCGCKACQTGRRAIRQPYNRLCMVALDPNFRHKSRSR